MANDDKKDDALPPLSPHAATDVEPEFLEKLKKQAAERNMPPPTADDEFLKKLTEKPQAGSAADRVKEEKGEQNKGHGK